MPGRFELTSTLAKIWHAPDHFRLMDPLPPLWLPVSFPPRGPAPADAPPGHYCRSAAGDYRRSAPFRG